MPTKKYVLSAAILLLAGLLTVSCASVPAPASPGADKDAVRISGNSVMKRGQEFYVRAFYLPDLIHQNPAFDWNVMTRIVEVGGTTVAFDLYGFSADGKTLDPTVINAVTRYAEEWHDSHTAPMVRVLGAIPPDEKARRKEAVRATAAAFADCQRAIFWIDGPDAAELTTLFRKLAPRLFTVSPRGGHLTLADSPDKLAGPLAMANGFIPDDLNASPHFVVPDKPDLYALLDQRLTTPEENIPWNPDPSLLSEEEAKEGFLPLFDGKTMNGWRPYKPGVLSYEPRNGCLEWVRGGGQALVTARRFDNFILRFDWKIVENGNSGVWLRAPRAGRAS
ncbi:MAG TPA: DUF1080 domain-containing protein, partial [Candidatus Hydrogenedentes bacterium]|nr:DUF1080 domain-containing protein [Candidatus Hydrogenedentota bacterium]